MASIDPEEVVEKITEKLPDSQKWKDRFAILVVVVSLSAGAVSAVCWRSISKGLEKAKEELAKITDRVNDLTTLSNQIVNLEMRADSVLLRVQSQAESVTQTAQKASESAITLELGTMSTLSNLAAIQRENMAHVLKDYDDATTNATREFVRMMENLSKLETNSIKLSEDISANKTQLNDLRKQAETIRNSVFQAGGFRSRLEEQTVSRTIFMTDNSVECCVLPNPEDPGLTDSYAFIFFPDGEVEKGKIRALVAKPQTSNFKEQRVAP